MQIPLCMILLISLCIQCCNGFVCLPNTRRLGGFVLPHIPSSSSSSSAAAAAASATYLPKRRPSSLSGASAAAASSIGGGAADDDNDSNNNSRDSGDLSSPTDKSAIGSDDDDENSGIGPVPTLLTLLRFTIPTLGIWLAGPIMSLVDTSVVGLSSSVELAAMGPVSKSYVCMYVCTYVCMCGRDRW